MVLIKSLNVFPADIVHKGIDIGSRLGAIVHVIGMFIHIEGETRACSAKQQVMVRGPLIDQFFVSKSVGKEPGA
jgi:hypothetical protein